MRHPTSRENVRQVMQAIGTRIRQPLKVYFTGGTTCVLKGWRDATIAIDLKPVPDLGMMADVDPMKLRELYDAIRPGLVRYPAIDEKVLSEKVERFLQSWKAGDP